MVKTAVTAMAVVAGIIVVVVTAVVVVIVVLYQILLNLFHGSLQVTNHTHTGFTHFLYHSKVCFFNLLLIHHN